MFDAHVSLYNKGVYWKKLVLFDVKAKSIEEAEYKVKKYLNLLSYEYGKIRVFKKDPA